jgi:hypothetical protein
VNAVRVTLRLTLIALCLAACMSTRTSDAPSETALPLLFVENGNLGWAGITLRMPRHEVERRLGRTLRVRQDDYVEVCGEWYSDVALHGRRVVISWTSAAADGVVEVLRVPYGGGERVSFDRDLSEDARARVPELVDPEATPNDGCPDPAPSFLVLRASPGQALNLKSSGEGFFFLTEEGCID